MGTSNLFASAINSYRQMLPELLAKKEGQRSADSQLLKDRGESIDVLLDRITPMPVHAVLLGQCTDGLPFLMDLRDPQVGAILISCDIGCGKTQQTKVMVESAVRMNTPRELQVCVISLNTQEWESFEKDPEWAKYFQGVYAWYEGKAESTIEYLTNLADDRRCGRRQGADVLFVLDDLNFVEELSYEAQVSLHWLLEYGAQSGVWPVATINPDQAAGFGYWLETFRTCIIGRIPSPRIAEDIARYPGVLANDLEPGEFRVWVGREWLTYALPSLIE
jgi:hypothetical protein